MHGISAPRARAPTVEEGAFHVHCVPEHHAGAVRFIEKHARIIKLPGGAWRVWLRSAGLRVYGSTRQAALNEAANRVKGHPINELLP
jgi:hypothetical protein